MFEQNSIKEKISWNDERMPFLQNSGALDVWEVRAW
jgi:hypothetical protein